MDTRRAAPFVVALHALACTPGTLASSPGAFRIAAGTPVTLHMRNGRALRGELARDDACTVTLDSGRIVVAKADIDTVETEGSYEAEPMHAVDEYGNKASVSKPAGPIVLDAIVRAVVITAFSNWHP